MSEHDQSASERPTPREHVLAGYLRDGLRPVEIAVRLGIPLEDVQARIERLHAPGPLPPALERPGAETPPEVPVHPDHGSPLSRVPLALLGAVALAFVVAVSAFIATSGRGGSDPPVRGPVPPEVFGQSQPIRVNGVPFEPVTLGHPAQLDPDVALLVMSGCDGCDTQLAWYVQAPSGLQIIPVATPLGLRDFSAVASRDGADLIITDRGDDGWAVFRSQDGGGSWVELWRGPERVVPEYAGPAHVALAVDGVGVRTTIIVPGGEEVDPVAQHPPDQTPWSVDFQIHNGPRAIARGLFGIMSEDGSRRLEAVESAQNRRGNLLGLYDQDGKLMKGWSASPAFPWGALLGTDAYVSGVVDLAGEFILHDEDEGPYPGNYWLAPVVFDTATGTVHRLELGLPQGRHAVILTAVRGQFARVAGEASCVAVTVSQADGAPVVACVPPGTVVVDLGQYAGTPDGDLWYRIRVPGGRDGWVPAGSVELLSHH